MAKAFDPAKGTDEALVGAGRGRRGLDLWCVTLLMNCELASVWQDHEGDGECVYWALRQPF